MNVLITNDDGYKSANLRALYDALKTRGHDVMISALAGEQSGKAASFNYFSPAPVGQDSSDGDIPAIPDKLITINNMLPTFRSNSCK